MNLSSSRSGIHSCLLLICILSSSGFVLLGCNKGPQRIVVTGFVKYQEKPLPHGAISFLPAAGTQRVSVVVAPIAEGKYSVEQQGGLPVGNYSVSIMEVYPATVKRTTPGERPLPSPIPKQRIPAKYNDQTQLKATIDGSQNPLMLNFALAP